MLNITTKDKTNREKADFHHNNKLTININGRFVHINARYASKSNIDKSQGRQAIIPPNR